MYGLMDLISDETQAMPPPRSRRGSTAGNTGETGSDDVSDLMAQFDEHAGDEPDLQPPISPLPATLESERRKNEILEERLRSLESKLTTQPSTEGSVDLAAEIKRQVDMALQTQAESFRNQADEQMKERGQPFQNRELEIES